MQVHRGLPGLLKAEEGRVRAGCPEAGRGRPRIIWASGGSGPCLGTQQSCGLEEAPSSRQPFCP